MLNESLLREEIRRSGLKKGYIASQLNLSQYGLFKKMNNENEFKASEIKKIAGLLNLTIEKKEKIFFADDVN